MENKKIIVQISEGLGNQLFMYAHAYALSKTIKRDLHIDNVSAYRKNKNLLRNHQKYVLHNFKIENNLINNDIIINFFFSNFLKKVLLSIDKFKIKKRFFVEFKQKINGIKIIETRTIIDYSKLLDKIYVIGNFEDPNYFKEYKSEFNKIFQLKNNYSKKNIYLINQLKESNSISIHLRRNRFSDQTNLTDNMFYTQKSDDFTNDCIDYINKSIIYFKNKINNPKFFIWSNDFNGIEKFTNKLIITDFSYIRTDDSLSDFYLFGFSKHFIVSPSSFHWWGAWLNENPEKICLRPSKINPSNNINFWPQEWISI
jgi:hypothetical protein